MVIPRNRQGAVGALDRAERFGAPRDLRGDGWIAIPDPDREGRYRVAPDPNGSYGPELAPIAEALAA